MKTEPAASVSATQISSTRRPSASAGRPYRFAMLTAIVSATSLFALLQAGYVMVRHQDFDVTTALGLAKAGVVAALPTVLGLALLAALARRWHRSAKQGDPAQATRALLFGAVAALGAWMLVDGWVAGPLVPAGLEIWVEIAAALAVGVAVLRRPPSAGFCRKSAWLAVVAILVLLIPLQDPRTPSESRAEVPPPAGGTGAEPGRAPDLVLISVDTLRADRLGAYGSSLALTPEIDRFAAEGIVFERALAASPWTVPSMASALTGLPTIRHGAGLRLGSGQTFLRSPLDPNVVTLPERLAAAGYRTQAVVANGFLSPSLGMARGFDEFDMPFARASGSVWVRDIPLARLALALYPVERWADYRASGVTDRALEILRQERPEPLFLWLHYIDPHTPFLAEPGKLSLEAWDVEFHQRRPEVREDGTVVGDFFAGTSNVRGGTLWLDATDRQRVVEYYDRAVAYVDRELGRLFAALREPGRSRPVLAAFTADHGEELWDHGHFEHGHDYYREVTRIPMILWGPERIPAGRVGDEPVGLVDLAPTLLELSGLEAPAAGAPDEGRSLVAGWRTPPPAGGAPDRPSPAAEPGRIRFSEGNLYGMPSVLLEEGPWRFILRAHGAAELYHAFDDPLELHNRTAEHPELVARYRSLAEPRLAILGQSGGGEAPELDAETRRALRSLGYVR